MSQVRHWKQRFDVGAKMQFRKSRKLQLCGQERCEPGDPVTEEMKQALGRHRLKMWWEAGMIELLVEAPESSEVESKDKESPAAPEKKPESTEDPLSSGSMEHTGGGWYLVTLADGSEQKVRGKKNAKALLDG